MSKEELLQKFQNDDISTTDVYMYLEDNEYFTSEELNLVTCICGYSTDTLNDMIYARYGYRDIEQLISE